MRISAKTLLLLPILCCSLAFGQNNAVGWYTMHMGHSTAASGNIVVKSAAGLPFVGRMSFSNTVVESGFFVDTLAGARVLSVHDGEAIPKTFALRQNYPNPFNPTTTIQFELPRASKVVLRLYNILGQAVDELVNGELAVGVYRLKVDGSGLASGVYFFRLEATGAGVPAFVETKKMMLIK